MRGESAHRRGDTLLAVNEGRPRYEAIWSGVLFAERSLLDVNVPRLKMPRPSPPAWLRVTVLLRIDREPPIQMPLRSPVVTLPVTVLPVIVMEPRFANTPPPVPIAGRLAVASARCRR